MMLPCVGVAVPFATAFTGPAWRVLVVVLAIIAAMAFLLLLVVGFQAVASWWRSRRRRDPVIPVPAAGHQGDAEDPVGLARQHLISLRALAIEGRAMRARLSPREQCGFGPLPTDLTSRFTGWKAEAAAALERWPDCLAQFQGEVARISIFEMDRKSTEIEHLTAIACTMAHWTTAARPVLRLDPSAFATIERMLADN